MARIHRVLAEGCEQLLREVLEKRVVLDQAAARLFRAQPRWGKRDRNFVASSVWGVVRWRRAHEFIAGSRDLRALLTAHWLEEGYDIPEWWTWQGADPDEMRARHQMLGQQPFAIRESVPDWLDDRARGELGVVWEREMQALNRQAPIFLRANRLRTTRAELMEWLVREGVGELRAVEGLPDAVELAGRLPKPLAGSGLFEIQDAGSQTVAPLLQVEPGMRVIDACAGAGGKTLHLASLMENEGELLALDVKTEKLAELKRRAKRARVGILRVELWDEATPARHGQWAERVLIDAPCSGLGTLRRQPDLKWRLSKRGVEKVRTVQQHLLADCASLLVPGGKMVYATCSLLPSENQEQVRSFLEAHPDWRLEDERVISAADTGWDGFYAARLGRL